MSSVIYQDQGDGKLIAMRQAAYESEDLLQELLAGYPDLLAGDQISSTEPRRWLLIRREMPVPDEQEGVSRWSLDHLFLDQDGVPTLVEVKRSSDTRIRREVVGQMLDYAANAVIYWPFQDIQTLFYQQCEKDGVSPEEKLSAFLDGDSDEEELWQNVKTNLQAGRIRMVFVADEIPSELRRIVEFLNGQMDPAEVLAIEIKQFVGSHSKTLIPRLYGQTEIAIQKKQPTRSLRETPWDEQSFLDFVRHSKYPQDEDLVVKTIEWSKKHAFVIEGGRGSKAPSIYFVCRKNGIRVKPLYIYKEEAKRCIFHFWFTEMSKVTPDNRVIEQLCQKLNRIPGVSLDSARQFPGISMNLLDTPEAQKILTESLDWIISQLTSRDVAL